MFQVTNDRETNVLRLALPEMLDPDEFDRLNAAILAVVDPKADGRWVLDLTGVAYAGSAALGMLVNIRQRVKQSQGRLVLCGLSPRLADIFRACCMERLFVIRKTQDEALDTAND